MNRYYPFLVTILLMLAACHDSKDEPSPVGNNESDVYVLVSSYDRDFVYNLDGDAIYCSPEGSHIASLQAEGSDWYALVKYGDGKNDIIKNGKSVFLTTQEITEFGVGKGRVFTLQRVRKEDGTYQWSYWENSKPRSQLDGNQEYSYRNMVVNTYTNPFEPTYVELMFLSVTPDSTALVFDSHRTGTLSLNEFGLADDYVISADFDNRLIYCYEDLESGKYMYMWNYEDHELDFLPCQALVCDYIPYILGSKSAGQIGSGIRRQPVVLVDGVETELKAGFLPKPLERGVKMRHHGNDVYILATGNNYSCIFKNLEPIKVKAKIPNPGYLADMISLSNAEYKDFIVVDK